jgi:tRNA-specific 2-thiouridylase
LGLPFYLLNVERPFKEQVVDRFVAGYASGVTPNPCLYCNRHIRFGRLLNYALSMDAVALATGHYARIQATPDGNGYRLLRGMDRGKDQSYVLHVLGQRELAHLRFPIGHLTKAEVRVRARALGLPVAEKAESQELCFIADDDYRRFLRDWAPDAVQPGPIVDRAGNVLSEHRGLPFYTIGQRRGLGIAGPEPLYVLALDPERNAVVVGTQAELGSTDLTAAHLNWISGVPPADEITVTAQIRYKGNEAEAQVRLLPRDCAYVRFARPLRDITPGQAVVFYAGDVCLGGGIIEPPGRPLSDQL